MLRGAIQMNGDTDQIRFIYFDLGRVLITTRLDARQAAVILGIPDPSDNEVQLVDHSIWSHRDAYDQGISDFEFWNTVAGDCGLPEPDMHTVEELVSYDTARCETVDAESIALVRDLKGRGFSLGILSNTPVAMATRTKQQPWAQEFFEFSVFSGEEGVAKPDQRIYQVALDRAHVLAAHTLFIDDREVNVHGAEIVGMNGLVWDSAHQAHQILADWQILGH